MLHYAFNATMLYQSKPWEERFRMAKEAGFANVEVLFPTRLEKDGLLDWLKKYDLYMSLFDLDVDDKDYPRGHLVAADERLFFNKLEEAVTLAKKTGTKCLNGMAGLTRTDVSIEEQAKLLVGRLQKAADMVSSEGITLLIEGLNSRNIPGYFVTNSKFGIELVKRIDRPNVKFQYDYFHMQIMEGRLVETVKENIDNIGYIQIAEVPGRHEPGTGEIDYGYVLKALADTGYDGYVGLELTESSPTGDPFAWLSMEDRKRRKA